MNLSLFSKAWIVAAVVPFIFISCSKKNLHDLSKTYSELPESIHQINLTNVYLSPACFFQHNQTIRIKAGGTLKGDKLILVDVYQPKNIVELEVIPDTDNSFTVLINKDISESTYRCYIQRSNQFTSLGSSSFHKVFNSTIPDIAHMTIKGTVFSQGKGIAGVMVSDGYETTLTDQNGVYYLPSEKKNKNVFISVPRNYEVATKGVFPMFFKYLELPTGEVEIKDFELTPVQNDQYTLLVMTDFHLANRTDDLIQYQNGLVKDVNYTIDSLKAEGKKVYGLTLGDLSWDNYWYSNHFGLPQFVTELNKLKTTIFNTIGNHDNDPYIASDWASEESYRKNISPTYYSFNLGKVHYIVLDDVQYINNGGSQGIMGDRTYNGVVIKEQMDWLKKDLAYLTDKNTPIVVATHIQLNNNPTINSSGNPVSNHRLNNSQELIQTLSPFSNVHFLTGHTHINYSVENSPSLMEHNIAAVCGTWWWTGKISYSGNQICKDGSPGGYAVWNIEDNQLKWYYKGFKEDKNYQFRAYDLNEIQITANKFAPKSNGALLKPYALDYATPNKNNEVLINVWGWDSKWKIDVTENGKSLPVTRVNAYDPLHIISYSAYRLNDGATPTHDFVTTSSGHFFKVKASSATSTLDIRVMDRFGQVYSQSMKRPKAFTVNNK